MEVQIVTCACGKEGQLGDKGEAPPGWDVLQIAPRFRCPQCYRDLTAANDFVGTPAKFEPDTLPKDSIGALKKLPKPIELHEKVKP